MIKSMVIAIALASIVGAQPDGSGWRSLFDGKTTAGWRGYRQQTMPEGWTVVDGTLTLTPGSVPRRSASSETGAKAGDIVSVDQFGDFELELEWKIAPGGNSGVFYRVPEQDAVIWHDAPEMQIIDDAGYKGPLKPTQKTGANYDLNPPLRDATRPAGEWNQSRIVARGNHVEHWLNGTKVVEYEVESADWKERVTASKFAEHPNYGRARRGHIAIQDHGDAVAFRKIRIRELT
jgi:hypothetical protein